MVGKTDRVGVVEAKRERPSIICCSGDGSLLGKQGRRWNVGPLETKGDAMTGLSGVDEVTGVVGEGGACRDVAIVSQKREMGSAPLGRP